MSVGEFLLRLLSALRPMALGIIAAMAATLLLLLVLFIRCRNVWVTNKRFRFLGLFFGLGTKETLRIACSWLKFVFVIVFLVGFTKLEAVQYIMFLIPGLILAVTEPGVTKKLVGLFWLVLQGAALMATNLICGFYTEMHGSTPLLVLYILMGIFVSLFSLYFLWTEIANVSVERDIDPEKIWGKTAADEEEE